jgi:poly(3-hydroxyalkanoate) synthetase
MKGMLMTIKEQKFKRNIEIFKNDMYILHYFKPKNVSSEIPVFVLPPHAGRHGNIAQRMIDICVKNGRNTYAVELLPATQKTKDTSINNLVNMIYNSQNIIEMRHKFSKMDLVCLCQGAWLGAIYTAKYQSRINRYCNFAGPINTKTGQDNAIEKYIKSWSNIEDMMKYHKGIVYRKNGIQPGYMQWLAFSMVDPVQVYYERFFNLMTATKKALFDNDNSDLEKFYRNNDWYEYTIDLAGVWFLDCLENHFGRNKLYDNEWVIGGEKVNLSNITCDVFLYAGDDDKITHPQQVFDIENKISSKNVKKTLFKNAGHTKVFVGKNELDEFVKQFFK